MWPVLLQVGSFVIYNWFIVFVFAFFVGMFVYWKRGRELYFDEDSLIESVLLLVIWFLAAARLGYVAMRFELYTSEWWQIFNIVGRPGFLYEAGMVGVVLGMWVIAKRREWDVYGWGDALVVGWCLGLGLMQVASFLNGSGYGLPSDSWFAVAFPNLLERRHPTQLYGLGLYAGLFGLLWWLESNYRTFSWYKGKRSEALTGFIAMVFLMGHGLIELLLAVVREGISVYGIRMDGWWYGFWFVLGLVGLYKRSRMNIWDYLKLDDPFAAAKQKRTKPASKQDLGEGIL